jgi:aminoglycoside 3-N-acetyltransferase
MMKEVEGYLIKEDFLIALKELGLREGQHIMVHTSLKAFGYICGGAQTIIEACIETIGTSGTVVMPTQSWKNLDPSSGVHWEVSEEHWQSIRDYWPAYNKHITPTNTMGAVAEMFRTWPDVVRSDHPARSVAAWGRLKEYITYNHDLSNIFGKGSPVGKLYDMDGLIVLMGVGYDKCTALHLADALATYPSKRNTIESSAILIDGNRQWCNYETLYVDGEDFEVIGHAFEQKHVVQEVRIGKGFIKILRQRELVDFAVEWIENNRK